MTHDTATVAPSSTLAPPPWNLVHRVAFRFATLYWLLYAFPELIHRLLLTIPGLWRRCTPEGASIPQWAAKGFEALGSALARLDAWWRDLTRWLSENDWTMGLEVKEGGWEFGDSSHGLVRVGCVALFSVVLTALWTVLDRRRSHPILGRWVHLGARWWLALVLLGYGMAKFYGQFPIPDVFALTREVGDQTPSNTLWNMMGRSTPYQYMSGFGELLAFALLLHRRTALLGCCIAAGVMLNVAALNWLYDVPLKTFSTHLLLTSVVLMAPFRHRLWALFVTNRESTPVDLRVVSSRGLGWVLFVVGSLWGVGTAVNAGLSHRDSHQYLMSTTRHEPGLYGVWNVEAMILDGKRMAPTDATRWEHFAIGRGGQARARTLSRKLYRFGYSEDTHAGQITLTPRFPQGDEFAWQFDRSVQTRAAGGADRDVDVTIFRGSWAGKTLELHTVKRTFGIFAPFRWIDE